MIYITGDIHREQDIHKINPREFTVGNSLTENDYVIICGDFGCVWDGSTGDNFWLKWLDSLPWNTLFIDGNHENFDVLNTYPVEEYKGGKVHRIRSKVFHINSLLWVEDFPMMLIIVQNIKIGGKTKFVRLKKRNMLLQH